MGEVNIQEPKEADRPLSKEEFKDYRGCIGKLNWLCEVSRPDVAFETLELLSSHFILEKVNSHKKTHKEQFCNLDLFFQL